MTKNLIFETINKYIEEQNGVFVFPTQTAADLWADKIITTTKVSAVAMERFLAWDDFKGKSIKSHQKDKTSIPSTMRQIFTAQLICDNAAEPFLKSLIPAEFSKTANGFQNWLSGLLPSLEIWKTYYDKKSEQEKINCDDEDKDLLKLYERYKTFLDKNNLFDPAWERPPFVPDENHYYIFFPEILSDYTQYKNLLENSKDDITLIHLPEKNIFEPKLQFYSNSRTELRAVALQLRKIHLENKIKWDNIAISVPDMDSYGPYLDRELEIYEIPHVMRYAKPLSASGAGNFFLQLQQCTSSNFTFESIKNLLLNSELPWKEPKLSSELINFGLENNCICSFIYDDAKIDVWEKSFKDQPKTSINLINYYRNLKELITKITSANSFEKIRSGYFEFRAKFFDMENCPENTDKLISRCISELGALIDLERDFPECKVPSPYAFFINQISNTNYLGQTNECGVQVLPYRTGAVAPFDCQIILDASQSSISVIYKELAFLREDKRKALSVNEENNVSDFFVQLYSMNSTEMETIFTCGAKNFTGYSQPSSYLLVDDFTNKEPDFLKEDFYLQEKAFYLNSSKKLNQITETEKNSFEFWRNSQRRKIQNQGTVENLITSTVKKIRLTENGYRISATHLKNFFDCHRKWLIQYIISLKPQENEADLMNPFAIGNLYHKILELYCGEIKKQKKILTLEENHLSLEQEKLLEACVEKAIEIEKNSFLARELLLTTKAALLSSIKQTVTGFCAEFSGYSVFGTEVPFNYSIPEKNLILEGKLDCILQNSISRELVIVDFKSTENSIPKNLHYDSLEPDVIPDFQMPFYLYLLENQENFYPVSGCYFFDIKKAKTKEFELDPKLWNPTKEKLLECIDIFSEYLHNNQFFMEPLKDFETCNQCNYRAVCRKVFNVGKSE